MYPRFGMNHIAAQTAQARARAAQSQHDARRETRFHGDDAGVAWRMTAVIAAIAAVAGTLAWFAA